MCQKPVRCHFANNKSHMGWMEWMPMAHFEIQWISYIPRLIGLLLLETLVSARVPIHDIKNNIHIIIFVTAYTVCPTRYRTRHFFNNFTTNEDIAMNRDTHYRHILQTLLFISHTTKVLLFRFRLNTFIGVRIIKEMPGSVASGTHYIYF